VSYHVIELPLWVSYHGIELASTAVPKFYEAWGRTLSSHGVSGPTLDNLRGDLQRAAGVFGVTITVPY
jgi:hypothetical protein